MVHRFEEQSTTRVHCSPPSLAAIRAAEHALAVNDQYGDALRLRLAHLVRRFRVRLAAAGFGATGGLFPVQTLKLTPNLDARSLHERLSRRGIRTVLHPGHSPASARISFIITARHRAGDIDRAVAVLAHTVDLIPAAPLEVSYAASL